MKRNERKETERRMEEALEGFFGDSFRHVEFYYTRKQRVMLVTYEDFKPESEIKSAVQDAVGEGWRVVLKREYSDLTVMLTMLKLFKENRVAVVDKVDGEIRPYTIREYVWRKMEGR